MDGASETTEVTEEADTVFWRRLWTLREDVQRSSRRQAGVFDDD